MSDIHLPEGRTLIRVSEDNPMIQAAKRYALEHSLDKQHPTGAVVVHNGNIVGYGANGSIFHEKGKCIRKMMNVKSGTKYWLCPGCNTHNHAEQKALADAHKKGEPVEGADIYLWGHTYCCRWCWKAMLKAGIKDVYLPEL